jgi:hypothetical protein
VVASGAASGSKGLWRAVRDIGYFPIGFVRLAFFLGLKIIYERLSLTEKFIPFG